MKFKPNNETCPRKKLKNPRQGPEPFKTVAMKLRSHALSSEASGSKTQK